jgi:hypothetical protein
MIKSTSRLYYVDLDLHGYFKNLDKYMEAKTKEMGRSWLRTVLQIIPTWSKASRARPWPRK